MFCIDTWFQFSWVYTYVGMELLGHMVTLYLSFLRNCRTLFQSSCSILQSPQQCMRVPMSSHPHQHFLLCLFDYSHLNGCEVISQMILIFISLMANDVEHLFMYYRLFMYLLWRNVNSDPLPIFILSFYCRIIKILNIFWVLGLYQIHNLQIFSPILCGSSFHFLNSVLWLIKVFLNFNEVQFINFFIGCLCFWC